MANPIQDLKTILLGKKAANSGTILRVLPDTLIISTANGVVRSPYLSGYAIGQRVILTGDNIVQGKIVGAVDIPTYVV